MDYEESPTLNQKLIISDWTPFFEVHIFGSQVDCPITSCSLVWETENISLQKSYNSDCPGTLNGGGACPSDCNPLGWCEHCGTGKCC